MIQVAILTVSDSCFQRKRQDESAPAISSTLPSDKFEVCDCKTVPDEHDEIARELIYFADEIKADIIFTTGGTGLGPRDVTPEATTAVCEKMAPGPAEIMRLEGVKKTKMLLFQEQWLASVEILLSSICPAAQKRLKNPWRRF